MAGLDPAAEPLGVERTVATRTDLIAVSGRIDRLDDRLPGRAARTRRPGGPEPEAGEPEDGDWDGTARPRAASRAAWSSWTTRPAGTC